jgi:ABC-type multidrug transport system fused ATPase/permease subunit
VSTLRKKYLEAVLKQDVGFFDTDARTGDIVFSVSTDTLLVQDAISEKVLYQFDIQTPHSVFLFLFTVLCNSFKSFFFSPLYSLEEI